MFSVCKAVKPVPNKKSISLKNTKRKKRKKIRRRYFEHDTRTSIVEHTTPNINKIKLNNKINIYGSNSTTSTTVKCIKRNSQKKLRQNKKNMNGKNPSATTTKTTKQLQLQLIETQKQLQRQLHELQEQQKQSILSIMCAKCIQNPNQLTCKSVKCHKQNSCETFIKNHHLSNAIDSNVISMKCTTHKSKSTDGTKANIRSDFCHCASGSLHCPKVNADHHSQSKLKPKRPAVKSIILSTINKEECIPSTSTLSPKFFLKKEPESDNEIGMTSHYSKTFGTEGRNYRSGRPQSSNYYTENNNNNNNNHSTAMLNRPEKKTTNYRSTSRDNKSKSGRDISNERDRSQRNKYHRDSSSDSNRSSHRSSSRHSESYRSDSRDSRSTSHSRSSDSYRSSTTSSSYSSDSDRHYKNGRESSHHSRKYSTRRSKSNEYSPSNSKKFINYNNSITKTSDIGGSKRNSHASQESTTTRKVIVATKPKVNLRSMLASDSEIDDERFDRNYEELLTFETHEDERREQRLLKALSDIAAKAKQKIQSIISENEINSVISNKNITTNVCQLATMQEHKELKSHKYSDNESIERKVRKRSEDRYSSDYSSKSKLSTKKLRKDDDGNKIKKSTRSRSPSIPRRRGSPSFLDRRRITSARKKPIPYTRSGEGNDWGSSDED